MSRRDALKLTAKERRELLAKNPAVASKALQHRIDALFKCALRGESKPFGKAIAYLRIIEQQARHSPHLRISLWIERKCPAVDDLSINHEQGVADFIELHCSAILPGERLTRLGEVSKV